MAITSSFLFGIAKKVMLGGVHSVSAGIEINRLTLSQSLIYACLLKSSSTPDHQMSSSACISTSLFGAGSANRPLGSTVPATYTSNTNDIALNNVVISHSSNGVTTFDADDVAFLSISAGAVVDGILIYRKQTDDSDAFPIAIIDITSVTANGATINVNWDNGVNRIFSLT